MENTIDVVLVTSSVFAGFIGFFFVMKILMVWKTVDINVLKARVFLDPDFLIRNWIFIFITGTFIVVRRIMELFELLDIRLFENLRILFNFLGLIVVSSLVVLAYYWYKLVNSAVEHKVR